MNQAPWPILRRRLFALVLFALLSLLFPTALSAQSTGEITYMLVLPRTIPVTEAVRAAEVRVGSELFSDESNWERYYSSLRNGFNQGLAEGYAARVPRTDVRAQGKKWVTFADPTINAQVHQEVEQSYRELLFRRAPTDKERIEFDRRLPGNIDRRIQIAVSVTLEGTSKYRITLQAWSFARDSRMLATYQATFGDPKYFHAIGLELGRVFQAELNTSDGNRRLHLAQAKMLGRPVVWFKELRIDSGASHHPPSPFAGVPPVEIVTNARSFLADLARASRAYEFAEHVASAAVAQSLVAACSGESLDEAQKAGSCSSIQRAKYGVDYEYTLEVRTVGSGRDPKLHDLAYQDYGLTLREGFDHAGARQDQTDRDGTAGAAHTGRFRLYSVPACAAKGDLGTDCLDRRAKIRKVMEIAMRFIHDLRTQNSPEAKKSFERNLAALGKLEQGQIAAFLLEESAIRNRMALRNAVLPGLGYFFVDDAARGWTWSSTYVAAAAFFFVSRRAQQAAQRSYDSPFFTGNTLVDSAVYSERRARLQWAQRRLTVATFVVAFVYMYNVLDAWWGGLPLGARDIPEGYRRALGTNPYGDFSLTGLTDVEGSRMGPSGRKEIFLELTFRF